MWDGAMENLLFASRKTRSANHVNINKKATTPRQLSRKWWNSAPFSLWIHVFPERDRKCETVSANTCFSVNLDKSLIFVYNHTVCWTRSPTCKMLSFPWYRLTFPQIHRKASIRWHRLTFPPSGNRVQEMHEFAMKMERNPIIFTKFSWRVGDFCLYSHGLLNAFSDLRKSRFPVIPSHISDFLESRSNDCNASDKITRNSANSPVEFAIFVYIHMVCWTRFPLCRMLSFPWYRLTFPAPGNRVQSSGLPATKRSLQT